VLSGNRNFEGRVSPDVQANYLASPPLVVAYALAGSLQVDLVNEPLGTDSDGTYVYLKDIWPSNAEIEQFIRDNVTREIFETKYADVFEGDANWKAVQVATGMTYRWNMSSTYVQNPPYFEGITMTPAPTADILGARILGLFGDKITTDHISPAGSIKASSPAGEFLRGRQVRQEDFNQYGTRRGNHEVMVRGTFANIRIKNFAVKDEGGSTPEGGWAVHQPSGERMSIFEAALRYQRDNVPLVVFAGIEYGNGSSRDWAAKGTKLLGVRAVIVQSFERIHRSNLVGMGILPFVLSDGASWKSLGLTGAEQVSIAGLSDIAPGQRMTVDVTMGDGSVTQVPVICRIDTLDELNYYKHGGILPYVLRQLAA
jgi:aconitate hydratase